MLQSNPSFSPRATCRPAGVSWRACRSVGVAVWAVGAAALAQAQMVPRAPHLASHAGQVVSSSPAGDLATASIGLRARATGIDGSGLRLHDDNQGLWPHWEGRIGVVLDRPQDPLQSPFVLAAPAPSGLKMHSLHVLSDYYFSGGFRATAGLVRGSSSLPWWPSSQQGNTGLSLSMQRLDMLTPMGSDRSPLSDSPHRTTPYVGAGYSTRLTDAQGLRQWHFNADLGLISLNSGNIGRISRVLQGEQGVDELLRELRLRPVIKFSVNYAF